jgi:hypothetical protein
MRKNSTLNQVNFKYIYLYTIICSLIFWLDWPKSPGRTWQEGQLLLDSWTSVSLDRHSILLWGRGGGALRLSRVWLNALETLLVLGNTTLTSENEAIWNFYQDQTSSSRRQDSLGLRLLQEILYLDVSSGLFSPPYRWGDFQEVFRPDMT